MFSFSSIDRKAQLRASTTMILELWEAPASRTLLWHEGQFLLCNDQPYYFSYKELHDLLEYLHEPVYLGGNHDSEYFACRLKKPVVIENYQLVGMRKACRLFSDYDQGLMFYAQGMLNWHQNHAFCSRCGSDTQITHAGHARRCNSTECGKMLYPKIDPAVIFSIINNTGPEPKILLGRQKAWDENRYSTIAGFVEPGETLEDAVRREALEETGLQLEQVSYIASQAWPFPDSLMVGFCAQCSQQEITLVDEELEKAFWFGAREIESGITAGRLIMPTPVSISWHLIDRWFSAQVGYSLAAISRPG